MRFITMLLIMGAYGLVTGCTGMVRPTMTDTQAREAAAAIKVLMVCSQGGYHDADTTAAGLLLLKNNFSQYNTDGEAIMNMAKTMPMEASTQLCKDAAVHISMGKQQAAINRQSFQITPQYQYSTPKRTICNNIAGQMLCSTY
jgi:hypothetical protein